MLNKRLRIPLFRILGLFLVLILCLANPISVFANPSTSTDGQTTNDTTPGDKTGTQVNVAPGTECNPAYHPVLMGVVWRADYDSDGALTSATAVGGFYCTPFYASSSWYGLQNNGSRTGDWTEAEMSAVLNNCLGSIMGSYTRPGLSASYGGVNFCHMAGEDAIRQRSAGFDGGTNFGSACGDTWSWSGGCYAVYHDLVNTEAFRAAVTQEVDRVVSGLGDSLDSNGFGFGCKYLVTLSGVDVVGRHYSGGLGPVAGSVNSFLYLVNQVPTQSGLNHWAFKETFSEGIFALDTPYSHMYTGDALTTGPKYHYVLVDQSFSTVASTAGSVTDSWVCPTTWQSGGFIGYKLGSSAGSSGSLSSGRPNKTTVGTATDIYCYFQTVVATPNDVFIYENELNYMGDGLIVGQYAGGTVYDSVSWDWDDCSHHCGTGCTPHCTHSHGDGCKDYDHSGDFYEWSMSFDSSKYSIFTAYTYGYENGTGTGNGLAFTTSATSGDTLVFSKHICTNDDSSTACSYTWLSGNAVLNGWVISRDRVGGAYHGQTSGRGGANDRRGEWNDLGMPWTWGFSDAASIAQGSNPLVDIDLTSVTFDDSLSAANPQTIAKVHIFSHIPSTVTEQFRLATDVDTGWIKGNEALGGGSGIDIQTRVPMIVWVNGMPYPDLTYGVTRNLKMYDYLQVNLEVTDRIFSTDVTELQDNNVRDSIGDDAYLSGHVVAGGSMLSLSGGYTQFAGSVNGVTIRAARPIYYSGDYFDIYHQRLHTVHGGYLEMLPHASRDQAYDEVRMLIREYDEFIDELSVVYQSAIDTLGDCYIGEYVWSGVELSPVPDAAHEMTRLTPNATVTLNGSARSINGDSKYHFGNLSSAGVNNLIVEDLETDGTVRGLYLGIIFMDGSGGIGGAGQSMSGLVESYTPAIGFISHNPTGSSRMNALAPMVLDTASSWYNAMLLACARGFTVEETLAWRYNAYDTTYMDDIGAFTINSSNYSVTFSANAVNNADPDTVWFVNTVLPEYGLNYASAFEQQAGSIAPDDRLPNAFTATPGYMNPTSYWEVDNIDNWLYRTHMVYADGLSADDKKHWYTEYRKPVWMIGVSNTVKVTLPPEAYTVIDPIFQGENTGGVDGMYQGGPDKAWNTYMAAIASPDEVNRKVKLFDWEGTDYWLDLNTLGRSDVVYISNTNVSDSY